MTARTLDAAASDCAARIHDRLNRLRAAPTLADAAAVGALALLAWRALRARRHWRALAVDGALAWLTRGDPQ